LAVNRTVKTAALVIGVLALGLAICWAAGLVEFTYPNVVANEPLLHPQSVRSLEGTNMVLRTGEIIGLWPRYSSERSPEEISMDISNQVSRGGYEVDVDPKTGGRLEIFVRWPRKFRDSVPPFTIPIVSERVGRHYRKSVAFGTYLGTNSQAGEARVGQPFSSETNRWGDKK
jgi:hypothetical protein